MDKKKKKKKPVGFGLPTIARIFLNICCSGIGSFSGRPIVNRLYQLENDENENENRLDVTAAWPRWDSCFMDYSVIRAFNKFHWSPLLEWWNRTKSQFLGLFSLPEMIIGN